MIAQLTIAALLASTAVAAPFAGHSHHARLHRKQTSSAGSTFNINVTNNCASTKSLGLFQITSAFEMLSMSTPVDLAPGATTTIAAPYTEIGMRLSATADQGTAYQWEAQPLFEFGYSAFSSVEGTAYDLSVMEGSTHGLSVTPANSNCEAKKCTPHNCPSDQGWTNADQDTIGSPADTTCYYGLTDFAVTFCP